jgi:phosphate transport system substrate-binding protein
MTSKRRQNQEGEEHVIPQTISHERVGGGADRGRVRASGQACGCARLDQVECVRRDLSSAVIRGLGVCLWPTGSNVVHRSDGSGTTNIFTLYLAAASEGWKKGPGAGTAVDWPVDKLGRGQGGKGNPGVAAAIQNTNGAIGYVELAYARQNNILCAKMVNAAGKTVEASIPSTMAAIKNAQFDDKLTTVIVNSREPEAWPIAGFTCLIVNKSYKDCKKAEKLASFIQWALTNQGAIDRASKLLYAPLPKEVTPKTLETLGKITCNGKPVMTK